MIVPLVHDSKILSSIYKNTQVYVGNVDNMKDYFIMFGRFVKKPENFLLKYI